MAGNVKTSLFVDWRAMTPFDLRRSDMAGSSLLESDKPPPSIQRHHAMNAWPLPIGSGKPIEQLSLKTINNTH